MANITRLEKKSVTTKKNLNKDILCIYLDGKATEVQKMFFKKYGFRYFTARYDWAQHDNGQYYKIYKSQGCYYADYSDEMYNRLAKFVITKTEPVKAQPAPVKAEEKKPVKRMTEKQKMLAKLGRMNTAQLKAILDK